MRVQDGNARHYYLTEAAQEGWIPALHAHRRGVEKHDREQRKADREWKSGGEMIEPETYQLEEVVARTVEELEQQKENVRK